jgi:chromosome segregation ATPase
MNTIEALAAVIAENRQYINQLEKDLDTATSKAARFETQFRMAVDALDETQDALRLAKKEITQLQSELSNYSTEEPTWD